MMGGRSCARTLAFYAIVWCAACSGSSKVEFSDPGAGGTSAGSAGTTSGSGGAQSTAGTGGSMAKGGATAAGGAAGSVAAGRAGTDSAGGASGAGSGGLAGSAGSESGGAGSGGIAGDGGGAGNGGAGGSSGGSAGNGGSAPTCGDTIDDIDDGDSFICEGSGRIGEWFLRTEDFRSDIDPVEAETGGYVMQVSCVNTTSCVLGFHLNQAGDQFGTYDASMYDGFAFDTMTNADDIEVVIASAPTTPPNRGGTCQVDCSPGSNTGPAFEVWGTFGTGFNTIVGGNADLDVSALTYIEIIAHKNGLGGPDLEIAVDNARFY